MKIHKDCKIEACVSDDPTRPVLGNVQVREIGGKSVAVATNGWGLACVPVEAAKDEYGVVTPEALKRARRAVRGKNPVNIGLNGKQTFRERDNVIIELDRPADTWPDVTRVIPDQKPRVTIALSAEMILAIADAMGTPDGVRIEIVDELSPVIIRPNPRHKAAPEPKAFGVLMPLRIS